MRSSLGSHYLHRHRPPHLVLAVVLLGVSEDSVAESEHVLVRRILLVRQLLQTQQRTLPSTAVLEGSLQDAKDLKITSHTRRQLVCGHELLTEHFLLNLWVFFGSDLFEDVLFPHQFLSLSVGFGHRHVKDRLTAVDDVSHEENHILQQLDGKTDRKIQ